MPGTPRPIGTERQEFARFRCKNPLTPMPRNRYSLGLLLLDLNDPSKVLARSNNPIMEPIASYEQEGFFGNVVFTNGHIVNGDKITLYYGASDEVICKADFSITELLKTLEE